MNDNTPKKIIFMPGVLEDMEEHFTTEELQELLNSLKTAVEDGSLLDESEAVDLDAIELEDPELFLLLKQRLNELDDCISEITTPPVLH